MWTVGLDALERLARELRVWGEDSGHREYRREREALLWAQLQREQDPLAWGTRAKFLLDRRAELGGGVDAWLFDGWMLVPSPASEDPPALDAYHLLQVFVLPEGLDAFPLAEYSEAPPGSMRPQDAQRRTLGVAVGSNVEGPDPRVPQVDWISTPWDALAQVTVMVFAVVDEGTLPQTRRKSAVSPWWRGHSYVRLWDREEHLVAHLALLALRQEAGGEDLVAWLERYGRRAVREGAREYVLPAINLAVTNYASPLGPPRSYLKRTAEGLAPEGVRPREVYEEAARLDVSVETLYRWGREGRDVEREAERAKFSKGKTLVSRLLASQEEISLDAARKRIERRLQGGRTLSDLQRVTQELLDGRESSED